MKGMDTSMEILQILNNNVVVAKSAGESDFIAMGKGIGFGKKRGEKLEHGRIEKIFTLTDWDLYVKYKSLLQTADKKTVDLAERVISYANKKYPSKKFNEIIHVSLLDHLSGVIDRVKKGYVLDNSIWTQIRHIYREEFDIGLYAAKLLNEVYGFELGNDEAAFVAMHFINAQPAAPEDFRQISRFIEDIITIVRCYFEIEHDEGSMNYYRFVEHIKIISYCILSPSTERESDSGIYDFAAEKYPDISDCVNKIDYMLKLKHGQTIGNDDKAYLILYIERLIRK